MADREKEQEQSRKAGQEQEKRSEPVIKRSLFRKVINVFIGIFLGLFLLILLLVGFTQTKTFREFLRERVIALVNQETNGKLNIEKIEGTILTSLFLHNTSIVIDNDTLFFARNVVVKTSPLQLLLKKIYIRKILLEDVKIAMLQDQNGEWNFSKFIKPKPEDTAKASFPLMIQANDVQLRNIGFIRQSYSNLSRQNRGGLTEPKEIYPELNLDDLHINNLYFGAQAFIDINNSNYLLILKELSFKPNLSRFTLRNISGEFAITKKFASISNFYLLSDSSKLKINARIDNLNLFDGVQLEDLKNYPIMFNAEAKSFNFNDLSSFIGSTEILKGNPSIELKAHGTFGSLLIDKIAVDYRDTHIEASGKVLNLDSPKNLTIHAKINDTNINYKDINALLPTLKLPEYAQLRLEDVHLEFEGLPTNFQAKFTGNIDDGKLTFESAMNLAADPMVYNIKFETENLNLFPIININTELNSKGTLAGKGVSSADLAANLKFNIGESSIDGYMIDKLDVSSQAADRTIDLKIEAAGEKLGAFITGNLSFDKDAIPSYNLVGRLKNLNLAKFLKDEKYESDLNFYFSADGKNFNPDEITGTFSFGVDSSRLGSKQIDYTKIDFSFKKDSSHREILLVSDIADFKIDGNFSLNKAIALITYESKIISKIISSKIEELNPLSVVSHKVQQDTVVADLPEIVNENLKFNFDFKLKDFELIAIFMDNDRMDISGSGSGSVKNESGNFSISTELKLDYMVMMQKDLTIYLSDLLTEFNFTRDNRYLSFNKLFGTASITGKRFYTGSNVESITADIAFNQSKMFFSASANIEDMINAEAEGIINMTPHEQQLSVNKLSLNYDGIEWTNKDSLKVLFNPDFFKIVKCRLQSDTSIISLSGMVESSGKQDLIVKASGISGNILERYLLGFKDNRLTTNGSLDAKIEGKFENPLINLLFDLKDLKISSTKLGSIKGFVNYADKKLTTYFAFLDSTANESSPLFFLKGNLPVDLSFASVKERLLQNEELSLQLKSSRFDLSSLGRIVPGIVNPRGILTADVNLGGTFKNPVYSGHLNLTKGAFTSIYNNLNYKLGLKLHFDKQAMDVDSLVLANAGGSKYSGTITGRGGILFDGFKTKIIDLRFNGDLAVLGQQSQSITPFFYGDLFIGTDGDWLLTKRGDRIFFKGNVLMKNADLIYTTGVESGGITNKNFNFVFVEDSTKIDKELARFKQVLSKEKDLQKQNEEKEQPLNFDYEIGISTENSAKLLFILSQVANQKLIVEMRGDLKYSNFGGETRAQGAFELLPGSKLEFFKSFDAAGFIRFESDVTNPYLDIVATYTSDYVNPRNASEPHQDVAVKIKIKSPLSDLGKSLAGNTESIGVYIGARNIQNDIRETRYDYADAFSFILMGKFKDDLTAQDKTQVAGQTNLIGNTATSFLGSILTSFVNSAVGDLVNNIQISQAGEFTKFSLSGRIQNLRYTFGGTTEVFQNIARANIKFEYPFNSRFIIRLERKDPVIFFGWADKVSEIAFKYKFEF